MATDETTGTDPDLDEQQDTFEDKPKLDLDVKVDSPSACQRHITVTIGREDIDRYFEESISEMMPKANVPGFRPGRAPRKIVESRFHKDVVDQVKGSLLLDTVNQVSEDHDFSAISEPDFNFDAVEVPDEGPMTFEFDVEVRPDFDIPEWKGMNLERPTRKFTKKDVDNHITRLLSENGELVTHDGEANEGDYLVVKFSIQHNDKEVAQSDEQTICVKPVLSFRDCRIENFNKLMKGAIAGESRETSVTLSTDAPNKDLRGEELTAGIEILEVKRMNLPDMNQETLDRVGGYETEEALREAIQKMLEQRLAYHRRQRVRQQITNLLTESADWDLPPDLLNRQSHRELQRAVLELRSSGFDEKAVQAYENELRQNVESSTARALKEHFILERIAEEEKVDAEDPDFDVEIDLIADQRDESPRRVRARLEKQGAMDALRNQIIERKVLEMIESQAEFKDVKFKEFDNDVEPVEFSCGGTALSTQIPEAKHGPDSEALRQPVDHT